MGDIYVRRAFRMPEEDFWALHDLLKRHIGGKVYSKKKKQRNGAVNGIISSAIRLSVALRYFAGGLAYDISVMHGISHSSVYVSVWMVVDAVNKTKWHPQLAIVFPKEHSKQFEIAQ
ncbi:hypothetical protein SEMRO_1196_G251500.1 [Seminavis robusta]|uniref:Uncharacterized protein n=1 Tax=Seminavis robusta TaxID=568900 RepID=A0A9N8HSS6_9STRA|nr:hypothetical protein SEMRO_1196_G251500.1 [Seminavis robusta]|eukprot:Sro1196_g251500.1 n/a (117) ;mRNA; f:21468-21818